MTKIYRHRRNRTGNQLKALPIEAMYAAGVSVFSLILYAAIIAGSVYMSGETPKWLGGSATLCFCVALGAFIYNIGQMKTKTEIKYRIICLGISTLAMIVWTVTIVLGMIN